MNLLGTNILGSGFSFDIDLRLGAGAFVCGEETALLNSVMGRRGEPRPRPPFPANSGLWGKPTVINNVETIANVPAIMRKGAEWHAAMGTEKSKGTKVFALAGKINNNGLPKCRWEPTNRGESGSNIAEDCPAARSSRPCRRADLQADASPPST